MGLQMRWHTHASPFLLNVLPYGTWALALATVAAISRGLRRFRWCLLGFWIGVGIMSLLSLCSIWAGPQPVR
jgi:predicted membrane channel-forming protein YqfA (hemolysin III family)